MVYEPIICPICGKEADVSLIQSKDGVLYIEIKCMNCKRQMIIGVCEPYEVISIKSLLDRINLAEKLWSEKKSRRKL